MAAPRPLALADLPPDIAALIVRDGSRCAWCSRRLGLAVDDCTREHVIPRSRGGHDVLDNYLLACRPCNRSRRSRNALIWLTSCERRGLKVQRSLVEAAVARAAAADVVTPAKLSKRAQRARRKNQIRPEASGAGGRHGRSGSDE